MRWRLITPVGLIAAPAIYAAQFMTVEQAQHAAFPAATDFVAVDVSSAPGIDASTQAWQARAGGRTLGYFLFDRAIGKTREIDYSVAIGADGAVLSVEILEYRESHGGEVRLESWRRQFVGKRVSDPIELNSDIQNISGATLSCRHVTEGVKRLLAIHKSIARR